MTSYRVNDVAILTPQGDLLAGEESDALERELDDHIEHGAHRLAVDLSRTRHLSARSLGILAHAQREAEALGGHLVLIGARHEHRWLLELTGLGTVLDLKPGLDADGIAEVVRGRVAS